MPRAAEHREYFEVQTTGTTRLETLSRREAEEFADAIYKAENVIPDIFIHQRRPELLSSD